MLIRNILNNIKRRNFNIKYKTTVANNAVKLKDEKLGRKMSGWQIHSYGDLTELQFNDNIRIPIIQSPNNILIKIIATSINPIDIAMIGGYGAKTLNLLRCSGDIEFSLILGRDFSGVVINKGMNVRDNIKIGDKVWGVIPVHKTGCHAEYTIAHENHISHQPYNLEDTDAAALLYAGLTAWSGLYISGQLGGLNGALTSEGGGRGKRLCILGAAGGVGNIAVQIAKAENANVIASCSTDAVPLVHNLGVDKIIDYTKEDAIEEFIKYGPYDIILDCAGKGPTHALEIPWKYHQYVTFSSPLLKTVDEFGLGCGLVKNILNLTESNIKSMNQGGLIKWGYFIPVLHGIEYLKKLVEKNKLLPQIEEIYNFSKANEGYERVAKGHMRGKIVLNNIN